MNVYEQEGKKKHHSEYFVKNKPKQTRKLESQKGLQPRMCGSIKENQGAGLAFRTKKRLKLPAGLSLSKGPIVPPTRSSFFVQVIVKMYSAPMKRKESLHGNPHGKLFWIMAPSLNPLLTHRVCLLMCMWVWFGIPGNRTLLWLIERTAGKKMFFILFCFKNKAMDPMRAARRSNGWEHGHIAT